MEAENTHNKTDALGPDRYDVFVSFSSTDRELVRQIVKRLKQHHDFSVYFDEDCLKAGENWLRDLEHAIAHSDAMVVFLGPEEGGPWRDQETQLGISRKVASKGDFWVIPVLLPGASRAALEGFLTLCQSVTFSEVPDDPKALEKLVSCIRGLAPEPDAESRLPDEPAPYLGLRPFQAADRQFFFGRDRDIQQLFQCLEERPLTAVVGASGCGKSSLVRAGVLPVLQAEEGRRLRRLGLDRVVLMMPSDNALRELAAGIAAKCAPRFHRGSFEKEGAEGTAAAEEMSAAERESEVDALERRLKEDSPDGLRRILDDCLAGQEDAGCLIVVDQFEELFTQCSGHEQRVQFVASLVRAVTCPTPRARLLMTLRADFLPQALDIPELRPLLEERFHYLGAMGDEQLREVIEEPAKRVNALFERGLVGVLLRDMPREPGALPLLGHALHELWVRRKGRYLTHEAYEACGGVAGALEQRADKVLEDLGCEGLRETARLVFLRLTSLGEGVRDTRRRVPRAELYPAGTPRADVDKVIECFSACQARLIVTSSGLDEAADASPGKPPAEGLDSLVEIAHEALLGRWHVLRGWLSESRQALRALRRLSEHAERWADAERNEDYLYRGAQLVRAEEELGSLRSSLNALEAEFLEASLAKRDRDAQAEQTRHERELEDAQARAWEAEQREAQSRRVAVWFGILGLLIAVLFIVTGILLNDNKKKLNDRQRALARSEQATREAKGALAHSLASQTDALRGDPRLWENAKKRLRDARGGLKGAETSTLHADLGLWHLYHDSHAPLLTFEKHQDRIFSIAFSPDGKLALSGGYDHNVKLWEVATGRELRPLGGNGFPIHSGPVSSVAFSPDGKLALSGSEDNTLKLWDVASGRGLYTFNAHSDAVTSAAESNKSAKSSFEKAASKCELYPWFTKSDKVKSVAFSFDGRLILSGDEDCTLTLWDVAGRRVLRRFSGHQGPITSSVFSPDARQALSGSEDRTVKLWDVASGRELRTFSGHGDTVNSVAFSSDGKRALSGSDDRTLKLWDVATGCVLCTFVGHKGWVNRVAFSPDDRLALSGSYDSTVKLWDVASGLELRTFSGYCQAAECVGFSPDGKLVLSGSDDHTLQLRQVDSERDLLRFCGHRGPVTCVAYLNKGIKLALSGSQDKTLRLWDVESGRELRTLSGHKGRVTSVAFCADGKQALSASEDSTLKLWELESGRELRTFALHSQPVTGVAFSGDAKRALSASEDSTLKLWDVDSGRELGTFKGHQGPVLCVALSPDDKLALSGGWDHTVRLWDVASGRELRTFHGHKGAVLCVTFSSDGRQALSGGWDHTVKLWNVASGRELRSYSGGDQTTSVMYSIHGRRVVSSDRGSTLKPGEQCDLQSFCGHEGAVTGVAFYPGEELAFSCSLDKTIRLWHLALGRELRTFCGHANSVNTIVLSPEKDLALSGGDDNTLILWPLGRADEYWKQDDVPTTALRRLQSSPDDPTALSDLGNYWIFCRQWGLAADLLERARTKGARVSSLDLGRCYWMTGRCSDARRELHSARDTGKLSEHDLKLLLAGVHLAELQNCCAQAESLTKQGKLETALRKLRGFEQSSGTTVPAEAWNSIARLGTLTVQPQAAQLAAEEAVKLDPTRPEYVDTRGLARAFAGDLKGARNDFAAYVTMMKRKGVGVPERTAWLQAMDCGENPFTSETLAILCREAGLGTAPCLLTH